MPISRYLVDGQGSCLARPRYDAAPMEEHSSQISQPRRSRFSVASRHRLMNGFLSSRIQFSEAHTSPLN